MRITKLIVSLMLLALLAISFAQSIPWVTWYPDSQGNPGALPTFFSGTSSTVRFKTMSQYPGRYLSRIQLFIGGDAAGEWTNSLPWVVSHTMTVRFDSSHFPHGTMVKLKAVVETSGFGTPTSAPPFETGEIEVRNTVVYHEDPSLGGYEGTGQYEASLPNYELRDCESRHTTRDIYVSEIPNTGVIVTMFHGGSTPEGHLTPPSGYENIWGEDVADAIGGSVVPSALVYILSCHAGWDEAFAGSYRSSAMTPFAAVGFRDTVANYEALDFLHRVQEKLRLGSQIGATIEFVYPACLVYRGGSPWEFIKLTGDRRTNVKNVFQDHLDVSSIGWYEVLP